MGLNSLNVGANLRLWIENDTGRKEIRTADADRPLLFVKCFDTEIILDCLYVFSD
jgi:hypothetical protein